MCNVFCADLSTRARGVFSQRRCQTAFYVASSGSESLFWSVRYYISLPAVGHSAVGRGGRGRSPCHAWQRRYNFYSPGRGTTPRVGLPRLHRQEGDAYHLHWITYLEYCSCTNCDSTLWQYCLKLGCTWLTPGFSFFVSNFCFLYLALMFIPPLTRRCFLNNCLVIPAMNFMSK
jgi:hypothetical protein